MTEFPVDLVQKLGCHGAKCSNISHSRYEKFQTFKHSDDLTIRYTIVDLKNVVQICPCRYEKNVAQIYY